MDVTLAQHSYGGEPVAFEYRVTLWEQPVVPDLDQEQVGWGEVTFDLTNVPNVHDAIAWAESQLAAGAGCYSKVGKPVHDREYVLFVKAPHEDRYLQIAGSNPTLATQRVPRFEASD